MPPSKSSSVVAVLIVLAANAGGGSGYNVSDEAVLDKFIAVKAEYDALVAQQTAPAFAHRRLDILQFHPGASELIAARRDLRANVGVGASNSVNFTELSKKRDALAIAIKDLQGATDHMWLILCGALVFLMQAGFAMVEAGACRVRNVQNVLMKNLVDVCVGTLCWWFTGWTLAYGVGDGENNPFANTQNMFSTGFLKEDADGIITPSNNMVNWFFQWTFASAAATIVSGGVAERVQFPGYLFFTVLMTCFIYPCIVHWTWGNGWLAGGENSWNINKTGFMDFAGSGIVHMCGGVAALVGAAAVGPRSGRFTGAPGFEPHSQPLIVLGTFILWFGWYGFNCGSTLAMHNNKLGTLAAQVAMNTTISGATGGITVLIIRYVLFKKYDVGGMCNGILAGLVSITAPCANVESGSAFLIGLIGAVLYQSVSLLVARVKIDDPIDAFAVHGIGGAWGVIAAALFDWGQGTDKFHGWSGWECLADAEGSCRSGAWGEAFAANMVQVIVVALWTLALSAAVFVPLRLLGLLRVPEDVQEKGLDEFKHSPQKAYAIDFSRFS